LGNHHFVGQERDWNITARMHMRRSFGRRYATVGFGLFVLVALTVPALARDSRNDVDLPPASQISESERAAIFQQIKAFASVPVSIRDAIAIVEKSVPGNRVSDISFDGPADNLVYKIKAYHGDEIWNGAVDASTGKMIGAGSVVPVSNREVADQLKLDDFGAAGLRLSDAVDIAEKTTSGKAVSAGLGQVEGEASLLVVVVADGSLKEVSLTSDPGKNQIAKSAVDTPRRRLIHRAR